MYTLPKITCSIYLPTLDATLTTAIIRNIPKIDNEKNMVSGTIIRYSTDSDNSLPFHDRSVRVAFPSDYVAVFTAYSVSCCLTFWLCCSLFLWLCQKLLCLLTMLLIFPWLCQKFAYLLTVLLVFPLTLSEVRLPSDSVADFSSDSVRSLLTFWQCCWFFPWLCQKFAYLLTVLLVFPLTLSEVALPFDYVADFSYNSVRSCLTFWLCCWLFLQLCQKLPCLLTMLLTFPLTLSEVRLSSDSVAGFSPYSVRSSFTFWQCCWFSPWLCQKFAYLLTVLLTFPLTLSEVRLPSDSVAGFPLTLSEVRLPSGYVWPFTSYSVRSCLTFWQCFCFFRLLCPKLPYLLTMFLLFPPTLSEWTPHSDNSLLFHAWLVRMTHAFGQFFACSLLDCPNEPRIRTTLAFSRLVSPNDPRIRTTLCFFTLSMSK